MSISTLTLAFAACAGCVAAHPSPLASLRESIEQQRSGSAASLPVVSLELFFEGNTDLGSIGCNLTQHPGIPRFYNVLRSIRSKRGVQDVLVEISDDGDRGSWPFSDRVYILADSSIPEVSSWVEVLQPDEVTEGWAASKPPAAPHVKGHVFAVWWD